MATLSQELLTQLQQALAAQETLRPLIGDAAVEVAVAVLQQHLTDLEKRRQIAPSAQRRYVTVLFADLANFTQLAEQLDAEDVTDLVNALWQRLDSIILSHGGYIDKHLGDGVMALWGALEAQENDAERAVQAGLAMQAALQNQDWLAHFPATLGSNLHIRVSINSGLVWFGAIGLADEMTAMGDVVNVAARLQDVAPAGKVVIGHTTYRQVFGLFDVQALPPVPLKGKSEPAAIYTVLQAKPHAVHSVGRGGGGRETRMVGRERELHQIQQAYQHMAAHAQACALTIVGEAGLGKSRLLHEFTLWLDLLPERITFLHGRATQATAAVPFAIWRDLFANRFNILESDPAPLMRQKIEQGFAQHFTAEAALKAHYLGQWLGYDFSDSPYLAGIRDDMQQLRSRALSYLAQYFTLLATEAPTVLVLEDIHWADSASLEVVEYLLRQCAYQRLLILTLTRQRLFEQRPTWAHQLQHTRLNLTPLSSEHTRALAADILRSVATIPDEFYELIEARAEGNPFYVEEIIKMFIEDEVIVPNAEANGPWHIRLERLANWRIPPTLTGVLQARLDLLPAPEKDIAQRAAVLGRIFWDEAVAFLNPGPTLNQTFAQSLAALRHKELIYRRDPAAFADTQEFIFKHALLRDVTYESVLKRDRRLYHARAADWLAQRAAQIGRTAEYAARIAEHYQLAAEETEAAHYYEQAGDQAYQRSIFTAALGFYQQAQSCLEEANAPPAHIAPLWRKRAETHYLLAQYPLAHTCATQAAQLSPVASERAQALAVLGEVLVAQGQLAEAETVLQEALQAARAADEKAVLARVFYCQGDLAWRASRLPEALPPLFESLALAQTLRANTQQLYTLNRLAAAYMSLGEVIEARRLWEAAQTLAYRTGNRERLASIVNNLGVLERRLNRHEVARELFVQALSLESELERPGFKVLVLINLCHTAVGLGRPVEAHHWARTALALAHSLAALPVLLNAIGGFANARACAGDYMQALQLLGLALRHPNVDRNTQDDGGLILRRLSRVFNSQELEDGLATGAHLDIEPIVQHLLDLPAPEPFVSK